MVNYEMFHVKHPSNDLHVSDNGYQHCIFNLKPERSFEQSAVRIEARSNTNYQTINLLLTI